MKIRGITKNSKSEYRVYFYLTKMLIIHFDAANNSGYSFWADYFGINDLHFEIAAEGEKINGDEVLIDWQELPSIVQAQIEKVLYQKNPESE